MTLKVQHYMALRSLAETGARVQPRAPEARQLFVELFDAGFVNVCPPGHRYRLNDAGRAELETLGTQTGVGLADR